jgi:DNA-binding response OmpR family regulator
MKSDGRILVIDDETVVCESCRRVLEQEGYTVSTATRGREGLERARTEDFDAVVVDIRMPQTSGFEVLRAVREHKPRTAVVMITAYPSVEAAEESARLGARDYLVKPFTPDEFCLKIRAAMGGGEDEIATGSAIEGSGSTVLEVGQVSAPAQILIVGAWEHASALQEIARCEGCHAEMTCNTEEVLQRVGTGETEILIFGLDAFRQQAYNLIPAVRKIREDIPIIVVSPDLSESLGQNARRGDIFFYLAEPFGPEEIKAVIRGVGKRVPLFKKAIPSNGS